MQTKYYLSNLLSTINDVLQMWYLRLALSGVLLLIVSVLAYVILSHLTTSAPQAGPCLPICAGPA